MYSINFPNNLESFRIEHWEPTEFLTINFPSKLKEFELGNYDTLSNEKKNYIKNLLPDNCIVGNIKKRYTESDIDFYSYKKNLL